ncbi:MAG: 5-methyltetrahydropteroyltriglutamate--homocysteine S-methyltransferase [Alphaproteobacteria bacterium]|nr:5-methyltetrahydropteroyltriglutamate--homocysteine S-methyltransferase [Alphaproteobacteria bacterium]
MMRSKPPFRADQVGSLLRSDAVKAARSGREAGDIDAAALKAVEDAEIENLIAKQQSIGLKAVTDGEYRRAWWHYDFLGGLDGVTYGTVDAALQFAGTTTKAEGVAVTGKLGFSDHPMLGHFAFVNGHTDAVAKMTIPSPSVLHFRADAAGRKEIYPDDDEFFADLGQAYADAVNGFYAAGCRYLQFDDTVWAYLCSDAELEKARTRGIETVGLQKKYAATLNAALAAKPDDMTITMHVCRGNFKSTWISEGGYEPVAETILGGLDFDGYFLEYDTNRAGGFEPLRFLPKGEKIVVLGLFTSKFADLEDKDAIKTRIDEASQYIDPDQLCLSPQCGFASTEEGNILTEDEQWAKLAHIVAIADEVWV